MKLAYISDNRMYLWDNGKISEIHSERVNHYTETVRSIQKNKEWKETGTGAQFMGTAKVDDGEIDPTALVHINRLAKSGNGIIFSMTLGDMGAIYRKDLSKPDSADEHIFTEINTVPVGISEKNGRLALAVGYGGGTHISVYDYKKGWSEITDGDSIEEEPVWSETDNRIFCSTVGMAISGNRSVVSPRSVLALDIEAGSMEELFADENYDYLRPQNDSDGNFYYIKQPYKIKEDKEPLWKDILLFPVRIIKALAGLLNVFSIIFGGESLRGGKKRNGNAKIKEKSERELFFEGRILEAKKNEKENASKGEKNPGILPYSRVLVKNDGSETVIKRGVLDYKVLSDGSIVCSDGKHLLHIKDGEETVLAKTKLARSLCVIEE